MNPHIQAIRASGRIIGRDGQVHSLQSGIDAEEGGFIERIIAGDPTITKTLEIGCAYGLSSLHICHAVAGRSNPRHTIIDPFQFTQWEGIGVRHLEESGITFFNLVQERSEFALPSLLQQGEGTFDFIFIDGWHTFDHTLIDCFYATRLLRTGGYLLIDDVAMPAVRRVVDYLLRYPCYERAATLGETSPGTFKRRLASAATRLLPAAARPKIFHWNLLHHAAGDEHIGMIALRKTAADDRSWDWYAEF